MTRYLKACPRARWWYGPPTTIGKYLLRTNTDLDPEAVVAAYNDFWRLERAFRTLKSALDLRPMVHWTERQVRGHVMACFLALVLQCLLYVNSASKTPRRATTTYGATSPSSMPWRWNLTARPTSPGPSWWAKPTQPSKP